MLIIKEFFIEVCIFFYIFSDIVLCLDCEGWGFKCLVRLVISFIRWMVILSIFILSLFVLIVDFYIYKWEG